MPSTACYYISPSHDPFYNISLEDYLYTQRRDLDIIYMLWINSPSVFMGRYQAAEAETDWEYLQREKIPILRRSSGGGTVYHDLGNLNFTSIQTDHEHRGFDLSTFPLPIMQALAKQGVRVERSPRGDLRLDGLKVGGSAETTRRGRMLYHLSLLYDANLDELERVLQVPQGVEVQSRVASVRSRVTNLAYSLPPLPRGIQEFGELIVQELRLLHPEGLSPLILPDDATAYIEQIRRDKYQHPDWIHAPMGTKSTIKR